MCHFPVDLLNWEKNLFHQLKNFIYSCLFWPLTCWFVLSCLKFLNMGVCHFAVDLLNWRKSISPTQKFPIQVFFCPLTCWIKLSCLKMPNVEVCHIAVDLLNWKRIYFANSKISYTGVFLSVDLLNWAILPKNAECGGISFCCWLVELRNNHFHQLKNFIYRWFFGRWLVELTFPA